MLCRNLTKLLPAVLKDEKGSHDDNKGKPMFQAIVIELYKQQKKTKKEHLRLVISSIRVSLISSVLEQLTVVLASVFFKNLKHLSYPILVLLFQLLTGKLWLGKASLTFCQITVMST